MVVVPGAEGELGVLPRHAPIVARSRSARCASSSRATTWRSFAIKRRATSRCSSTSASCWSRTRSPRRDIDVERPGADAEDARAAHRRGRGRRLRGRPVPRRARPALRREPHRHRRPLARPVGTPPVRISVVGGGSWGTAFASHLARSGHDVVLLARDAEHAAEIEATRENPRTSRACGSPTACGSARSPPASHPTSASSCSPCRRGPSPRCWRRWRCPRRPTCSRWRRGSTRRPAGGCRRWRPTLLGDAERVAVLSGPNHAEEIARGTPAATVVASPPLDARRAAAGARSRRRACGSTRTPTSSASSCARAAKNVIALAAGVSRRPRLRRQRQGGADHARPRGDDAARRRRSAPTRAPSPASPGSATSSRPAARRTRATAGRACCSRRGRRAGRRSRRASAWSRRASRPRPCCGASRARAGPRAADHGARRAPCSRASRRSRPSSRLMAPRAPTRRVLTRPVGDYAADLGYVVTRRIASRYCVVDDALRPLAAVAISRPRPRLVRRAAVAATTAARRSGAGAAGTDGQGRRGDPGRHAVLRRREHRPDSSAWEKLRDRRRPLPRLRQGRGGAHQGACAEAGDGRRPRSRKDIQPWLGGEAAFGVRRRSRSPAASRSRVRGVRRVEGRREGDGRVTKGGEATEVRRLQGLRRVQPADGRRRLRRRRQGRRAVRQRQRPRCSARSTPARAATRSPTRGTRYKANARTLPEDNVAVVYVDGPKLAQLAGTASAARRRRGRSRRTTLPPAQLAQALSQLAAYARSASRSAPTTTASASAPSTLLDEERPRRSDGVEPAELTLLDRAPATRWCSSACPTSAMRSHKAIIDRHRRQPRGRAGHPAGIEAHDRPVGRRRHRAAAVRRGSACYVAPGAPVPGASCCCRPTTPRPARRR